MALFGSDWIEDKNDYDRNHSIPKQEDYDSLKEYENNHHIYSQLHPPKGGCLSKG